MQIIKSETSFKKTYIEWCVTDKSKITISDIIELANYSNEYDNYMLPSFTLCNSTIRCYHQKIDTLIKRLINDDEFTISYFMLNIDDDFIEAIKFIVEEIFELECSLNYVTKRVEIGCDQFKLFGFDDISCHDGYCGCEYIPDDFWKYHTRNNYDDNISYSDYPMELCELTAKKS